MSTCHLPCPLCGLCDCGNGDGHTGQHYCRSCHYVSPQPAPEALGDTATTPIEAGAAAIDVEMDSQGIWGLATNEDLTKAVFESIDEDRLMDVLIVHTESVRGGCICGWESHDMAADIPGHQAREIKAWLNGGS